MKDIIRIILTGMVLFALMKVMIGGGVPIFQNAAQSALQG